MARFCTECGSPLAEDMENCPSCGTAVTVTPQKEVIVSETEHYVPDEGVVQMFFRHDNRLNRKRYIKRLLVYYVVAALFNIVLLGILFMQSPSMSDMREMGWIISLFGFLCNLPFAVSSIMLKIRRLHDLDRPGWNVIGQFIPFVNIVLLIYLLFYKGTDGPNRYGPDPLEGEG